jgi:hypothetical protein
MMKKAILGMMAALAAVVMVSCSKSAGSGDGQRIEQTQFSVVLPDGWSQGVTGEGNYENLNLTKEKNGQTAKLSFHAYDNRSDSPTVLMQKMCRTKHGWVYQANQKIGDNTWNVAYAPNTDTKFSSRYQVFTALKQRGVLVVQVENVDLSDEEVQAILESVVMK